MRKIGSLLGIAVLGAVLQSRLAGGLISAVNSTAGIPDQVKITIAQAAMVRMFTNEFAGSLNTAMIVAAIFCLAGAAAALFIKNPGPTR